MKAVAPLPPGSYAWCGECTWRDDTPQAEVLGRAHSDALQHIVHVYEAEVCAAPLASAFGRAVECQREPGHEGAHEWTGGNQRVVW